METQPLAQCPTCGQSINPVKLEEMTARIAAEKDKEYSRRYNEDLQKALQDKTVSFSAKIAALDNELKGYRNNETDLLRREEALKLKEQGVPLEVERRVKREYEQRYKGDIQREVKAATQQVEAKVTAAEEELKKFRSGEKNLLEREQAVSFRNHEIDLEVQRKTAERQDQLIAEAAERTENKYKFKLEEKDKTIAGMRAKLQEAEAKAQAAGAQQRGDVQEDDLLDRFKTLFFGDDIDQIAKSRGGADILHAVRNNERKIVGSILWESRNRQNWSEPWLAKLREDQRKVNADIAVIVSAALPEDQPHGGLREGVLVLRRDSVEEVAPILRQSLINIQQQKVAGQFQDEKAQQILEYLGGKEFNLLLTGIVEDMSAFRELDDKEERFVLRAVSQRRELRQRSTRRLARMFGTLQGIMGSLPEVPGLQLPEPPQRHEPSSTPSIGTGLEDEDENKAGPSAA